MRKLLTILPMIAFLVTFWALGYQSACERELERAQHLAPGKAMVELTHRLATMPTTQPVSSATTADPDDCP